MVPLEPALPETRDRRCPACASEVVTATNHLVAIDQVTKEEFRCEACGTAFWIVRKRNT
jgi:uncharacterized protein with PIN domain